MLDQLSQLFVNIQDDRTKHFALTRHGLWTPTIVVLAYLIFANWLGPWWMRSRKPFNLKYTMFTYNLCMSALNIYFNIVSLQCLSYGRDIFNFNVPDPKDTSPKTLLIISTGYLYLLSKYLDFADTLFFVLRKKNSHLSFLHLYHHSVVAFGGSVVFIMYPTMTPMGLFVLLNSLIHTVMYAYYGLAALGPSIQPYLWWKKYITQLQISQFIIYLIYFIFFVNLQSGYNYFILCMGTTQVPFFTYLFVRFYLRTYVNTDKAHHGHHNRQQQKQEVVETSTEVNNNDRAPIKSKTN